MCGIAGFLDKANDRTAVGQTLLKMLAALGCRGPDSAGVAVYCSRSDADIVLRVKLGEVGGSEDPDRLDVKSKQIADAVQSLGLCPRAISSTAEYLRLVVNDSGDGQQLERIIESADEDVEVVSMGRKLEIIKQVGSPQDLDATYCVSTLVGSHGIGHTRLSTESRVDLSHSQPFWAHGYPDLAIVHNGHITNYHKLRRRYEQRGVRFYTENDSEIIGVYLAERLSHSKSLEESMRASLVDLDGSFSYLAATSNALGFCKDPFAFKPLLFTETDDFVAIATEEIAIRSAFADECEVREAQAKEVRVWQT